MGKELDNARASSVLTVDLNALQENYKFIQSKTRAHVSGVIKADGYGLGAKDVFYALKEAGCTVFFVATLEEALEIRNYDDACTLYTLNGLFSGAEQDYIHHNITPALGSAEESLRWIKHSGGAPCALHFDTGMNRLGINPDECAAIFDLKDQLNISMIMSHFISSEDKDSPLNQKQYDAFMKIAQVFPDTPKSLCNSSGIFLSDDYHLDLVRPGVSLYGANPTPYTKNPMQAVVNLKTRVLQTHNVQKGETAGYNATHTFDRNSQTAIVSMGYADGFLRTASNNAKLYWNDHPCPIRGRISMDLVIVDITDIPENPPIPGDWIEVLGPHQSVDALAQDMGTIGYEVLTSLGSRYTQIYKG